MIWGFTDIVQGGNKNHKKEKEDKTLNVETTTVANSCLPGWARGTLDYSRFDAIGSGTDSEDDKDLATLGAFCGLPP